MHYLYYKQTKIPGGNKTFNIKYEYVKLELKIKKYFALDVAHIELLLGNTSGKNLRF